MQFAVFKTGAKQYKAVVGESVKIEKLLGEYQKGDKVTFNEVLLLDDGAKTNVGTPTLSGKTIEGEIVEIGRNKKIDVIKYKAKSNYFKKRGHRQPFFKVKITKIG